MTATTRRFSGFLALGVILIPLALGFTSALWGDHIREPLVAAACYVTICTAPGMAAAGWLILALPAGLFVVMAVRRTFPKALVTAAVLSTALAWFFVPGKRSDLDDLLDGYAELAFATGLRWAGLGLVAAFVVVLASAFAGRLPHAGRVRAVALVLVAAASLGVAMYRGKMPPMTAAAMFPYPSWTSAGDVLTVTGRSDRTGCDGVVANDQLLAGCLRTARASFRTDDSDAVVHLAAVLFPSHDYADRRRDALPGGTGQMGFTGDTRTTRTVTEGWLILTTVQHADRRAIAGDQDAGPLLWALKQVGYRFTGEQIGLYVSPEPKPPIAPMTP